MFKEKKKRLIYFAHVLVGGSLKQTADLLAAAVSVVAAGRAGLLHGPLLLSLQVVDYFRVHR